MAKGFGRALKNFRRARGLTQVQLGNVLNLHYSYISQLESGKRTPTWAVLLKINRLDVGKPVDMNQFFD